jgi:hypothetical protein
VALISTNLPESLKTSVYDEGLRFVLKKLEPLVPLVPDAPLKPLEPEVPEVPEVPEEPLEPDVPLVPDGNCAIINNIFSPPVNSNVD